MLDDAPQALDEDMAYPFTSLSTRFRFGWEQGHLLKTCPPPPKKKKKKKNQNKTKQKPNPK